MFVFPTKAPTILFTSWR